MEINYNTLTAEQLEEYAEFVDWSMVPSHLLTDDVRKSFGFLPALNSRLWFEDLLPQMVIKEDQKRYPYRYFFFIDDKYYMDLNFRNGSLWCSNQNIWLIFLKKKNNYSLEEIQLFIRNIMEQHYDITINPFSTDHKTRYSVEAHFKNMETISLPLKRKSIKEKLKSKKITLLPI